jgi:2-phospho-L-lactate guanylyltransferase (CobY/MobA/RfbA family)
MSRSLLLACAVLCTGGALLAGSERACLAGWGQPSAVEERIAQALKEPTRFEFLDTPLQDVVETLKDLHQIDIQIHKRALEEEGIPPDSPVTRDLKGISLRSALRLMLGELDLTYVITDEVLLITTQEEADTQTCVRVYPVADLIGRGGDPGSANRYSESLVKAIKKCIVPNSWDEVGGRGSISTIPPERPESLVVMQSQRVHEEIGDFLKLVRGVAGMKQQGDLPPASGGPLMGPAEMRIAEELKAPTRFEFIDTPLEDAIDTIKDMHAIEIQIDERALEETGLPTDMPVTAHLKGISLRSALDLMLGQLDLTHVIQDEVLLITTIERAEIELLVAVYPFRGPAAGERGSASSESYADGLVKTITTVIQPETWDRPGGPGNIVPLSLGKMNALVILQRRDIHPEIAGLLARPEFQQAGPAATKTAPRRWARWFWRR